MKHCQLLCHNNLYNFLSTIFQQACISIVELFFCPRLFIVQMYVSRSYFLGKIIDYPCVHFLFKFNNAFLSIDHSAPFLKILQKNTY